ncbi:MAG: transglutaminase family protein [Myxococcales bacterium]|nr:transglutaminase family protein [Myxococcales bacterium]
MRYRVRHITSYAYADSVALSRNVARLVPRELPNQRVTSFSLKVDPQPASLRTFKDAFGNDVHAFTLDVPHKRLSITADSELEVFPSAPLPSFSPAWETVLQELTPPLDVIELCFESPLIPRHLSLASLGSSCFWSGRPIVEAGLALSHAIHATFTYDPAATTVTTPVLEALERRRGVCQDFAQVLIGALRSLGLPARYVSGYLETMPPPGRERLVGADASHAWVELWCGSTIGWLALDPTNDVVPSDRHVIVAYGRDFSDVSPVKGMILGGGAADVGVSVDVERLP